ncbi:MAG: TonB-dependent receptor plug domain-containing protein [Rhodospirillales bacterium]
MLLAAAALAHVGAMAAICATLVLPAMVRADETAQSTLPVVVVTAHRVATPVERIASSITVITGEELEKRGETFVIEALRNVPGLAVSSSGGSSGKFTQLRIRGSEANQTLVLVDGIEVNSPNATEFQWEHLTADNIERIEILRGPQSALYGSDAIGGVVNIITKRGKGPMRISSNVETGSYATKRLGGAARGSGAIGNSGVDYHFSFGANGFTSNGISAAAKRTPTAANNTEDDRYERANATTKFGIAAFDGAATLDVFADLTRTDSETDSSGRDVLNSTTTWKRYSRVQGGLNLFGGAWNQTLGLGYTSDKNDNFQNEKATLNSLSFGQNAKLDYQSAFRLQTAALVDAAHQVVVGYELENEKNEQDNAFAALTKQFQTRSFFGEYTIDLFDSLFLGAGGRTDDRNNLSPDATTWRLSAAYLHRATGTKLKSTLGTGQKQPTFSELFGFFDNFVGNPNLLPERSRGWDGGIEQSFLDDRLKIEAVYFENDIANKISSLGTTAVNIPGTFTNGAELTLRYSPTANLGLGASYTYSHCEENNGGECLRRAKHIASFNANYRFLNGKANANLNVAFNGRQMDQDFETAGFPRIKLGSYTLVDFTLSYKLREDLTMFGRVANLLNEDYQEVRNFGEPGTNGSIGLRARF